MKTTPLHPRFGVRIDGVDLRRVSVADGFPEIRALFEEHSLLLFEDQQVDDAEHVRLCRLFGPMEDRSQSEPDPHPGEIGGVTNLRPDGTLASAGDLKTLNLQANMLWHTDSTFLPVPALINMIVPRMLPSEGGATEFASARAAFERLEPGLQGAAGGDFPLVSLQPFAGCASRLSWRSRGSSRCGRTSAGARSGRTR